MNLVAAEYVACQKDRYGVLVLSELAGAAAFMGTGSITFNPSSGQQVCDSIYKAATMSREEKKTSYESLEEFVNTNTRYVHVLRYVLLFWWYRTDVVSIQCEMERDLY
jgi:trehalose 6-phosphate synthase